MESSGKPQSSLDSLKANPLIQFLWGYIFLASGLLVNCMQFCMIPLWYMGKTDVYRRSIRILNKAHWTMIPSLAQWWANLHVDAYATPETFHLLGKEPAIPIMNHRGELDWIVSWIMCDYASILGNAKCFVKNVIRYIPCVGWSFWMSESIFLKRSLEHDKKSIDTGLKNLCTFEENFWVLIFCEGTRFTEEKHVKSMEFARQKGIPELKHHLLPRTKGFTIATNGLRSKVKCVYDVTVAWKDGIELTLHDMVKGKSCVNSCLIRRIPIEEVPVDEKESSQFVHKIYREKDQLADFHMKNNRFPSVLEAEEMNIQYYDQVEHRVVQKKRSGFLLMCFWAVLTLYLLKKLLVYVILECASFYSFVFFTTGLAIVAGLFYVMMQAGKPQSSYGR